MNNSKKTKLQYDVLSATDSKSNLRWLLAPRSGKSRIAVLLIKRDRPKSILWVTPFEKLAKKDIPDEFDKWDAEEYKKNLTTTTWASLNKHQGHYDLIILDEEQYITETNSETLMDRTLRGRIISMTGTPTEHKDKTEIYKLLGLKVAYNVSINKAVEMDILSDYKINVVEIDLSAKKDIKIETKKKSFKTSERSHYKYLSGLVRKAIFSKKGNLTFRIMNRMRFIKNSKSKLKAAKFLCETLKGRKLIFASTIEQAEALSEGTFHSKTDDSDYIRFKEGGIDTLAMVNSGGVGHTYKKIDHLILVQADSNKNGLTSQKIARTLLKQKNYSANVWILSLIGTKDEDWVTKTLKSFSKNKVEFMRYKNIKNGMVDLEKKS